MKNIDQIIAFQHLDDGSYQDIITLCGNLSLEGEASWGCG